MVLNRILQFLFIVLLLGIPLLLLLILEGKKEMIAAKKFYQALKSFNKHLFVLFFLGGFILVLLQIRIQWRTLIGSFFAIVLLSSFFFIGNYFGTQKKTIRENIILFLKQFHFVVEGNIFFSCWIVSLFIFLLSLQKESAFAFLGAAFFFFLTKLHTAYQKEKKEISSSQLWNIILLNIGIFCYLMYVLPFMISLIQKGAILGVDILELFLKIFFILIILIGAYHFDSILEKIKHMLKDKF